MPEVSITLPSLRPEAVLQRIKQFSMTNKGVDYEIIVVSPFPVKEERVIHVYEKEPSGNVPAHNIACKNSSGEYIVYWSDDIYPTANCLANMLRFVKSKEKPFIGAFRLRRQGQEKTQWTVYGKLYAPIGCVSRKTLDLIGQYFDPVYRAYWADPDMCLRTWEKGGRVEVCPDALVEDANMMDEVRGKSWDRFFAKDTETFFNRWHDKLGKGTEKDWRRINRPIYIPPSYFHLVRFSPSFMGSALFGAYFRAYSTAGKMRRALLSRFSHHIPLLKDR